MISTHKTRTSIVFIFFGALYTAIIFNLYLIQIRDTAFFTQLGEQQYNVTVSQNPPRAPIFDRSGKNYLAMNNNCISAFILPNTLTCPEILQPFLAQYFPHALEQLQTKNHKQFMYIKRKLSKKQLDIIEKAHIPDIQLLHESSRFYPVDATACIVGITDIDNKGIFGIELTCNKKLAGTPTTVYLEKDARTGYFYFKKETKEIGTSGNTVQLTISSNLQFLAYEQLKKTVKQFDAREGSVLIMDPKTGEIITMASYPQFNPNNTQKLIIEQTKNKSITDAYELGSVIKVFAALAALQEGVVSPDELIDCKNKTTAYIDGRKINTWKAHGIISFRDVVAFSNNIGIATIAKRLGSHLYDHYIKLGFGQKTGIPLPGEHTGYVNPPEKWSKQSIISLSYGYEISATLLQLACAFALIANNGRPIKPKLIMDNTAPLLGEKLYSDDAINTIKEILARTTQYGTARRAGIKGYTIMSKTGTANLLIDGVYNSKENIYTCAGIVEKDDYKRVIVTFVKQAKKRQNLYAANVVAPLFEQITQKMLIQDKII